MSTDLQEPTDVVGATRSDPADATGPGPGDATRPAPDVDPDDPREHIEVGVLLPNGRLVGRRFASRAEAESWARPEDGEQVVEYNLVCECSM